MSEMTLRAAKAIRSKVPEGYGMTGAEAVEYAKAVIEAMREPTDEMLQAACDSTYGPESFTPEDYHRMGYRAMIDEALK